MSSSRSRRASWVGMSWIEIREVLAQVRAVGAIEQVTIEAHGRALRVAERYGLSIDDALIVSAALLANCEALHWEDMQDGQVIERQLTIRNPFTRSCCPGHDMWPVDVKALRPSAIWRRRRIRECR